jgi:glycosyltransferase involved in cell wall biosynthesis
VRVIYQSVDPPPVRLAPDPRVFEVCVMGHLRPVKDPLRTALAARLLPESSRIQVTHIGAALSVEIKEAAMREQRENPRYRWLGDQKRWRALRILSRCRLLALTSRSEGGANVIGEAVTVGVPVVSSRIAGSVGLLGEDYPGYFPFGDSEALAALLHRAETDAALLHELKVRGERLRPLFDPRREREAWRGLLAELRLLRTGSR